MICALVINGTADFHLYRSRYKVWVSKIDEKCWVWGPSAEFVLTQYCFTRFKNIKKSKVYLGGTRPWKERENAVQINKKVRLQVAFLDSPKNDFSNQRAIRTEIFKSPQNFKNLIQNETFWWVWKKSCLQTLVYFCSQKWKF